MNFFRRGEGDSRYGVIFLRGKERGGKSRVQSPVQFLGMPTGT